MVPEIKLNRQTGDVLVYVVLCTITRGYFNWFIIGVSVDDTTYTIGITSLVVSDTVNRPSRPLTIYRPFTQKELVVVISFSFRQTKIRHFYGQV